MGGLGSGSWWGRREKKTTVEESLTLAMKDVRRWLRNPAMTGMFTWSVAGSYEASLSYLVTRNEGAPVVTLRYRWMDIENIGFDVRLEATPTQFGGKRWWFTCPLVVGGMACERRSVKLYLPPGSRYFGCRKCHDLTYRSCQEAHQMERLFR